MSPPEVLMRVLAIALSLCLYALPAAAQHTSDVESVRTLETCIAEHQTHLTRLVRLMDEAQERTSSSDEQIRHDAELSIETLLQRAADVREHLRLCVQHATFHATPTETVVHETTPDSAADHVAVSGSSIHEVEADEALGDHAHVVRGERVDGAGSASDDAVSAAVHGTGSSVAMCYESYEARGAHHAGTVHVSFTVTEGGRVAEATVERGGFDTQLRQCVQRAFTTMHVAGAHGRSVYGYELRLGD